MNIIVLCFKEKPESVKYGFDDSEHDDEGISQHTPILDLDQGENPKLRVLLYFHSSLSPIFRPYGAYLLTLQGNSLTLN